MHFNYMHIPEVLRLYLCLYLKEGNLQQPAYSAFQEAQLYSPTHSHLKPERSTKAHNLVICALGNAISPLEIVL